MITSFKNRAFTVLGLAASLAFTSCSEDDDQGSVPSYSVPATYAFTGADYSTSSNRVKMAVELNSYLGSGSTTVLDQAKATNLFQNSNAPFTNAALNTAGVNLAEKTADVATYQGFITQHVTNSNSNPTPAAPGKAGF